MPVSKWTKAFLERHGWSEVHRYDFSVCEEIYLRADCPMPPPVKAFASKYGGIRIVMEQYVSPQTKEGFDNLLKQGKVSKPMYPRNTEINLDFRVLSRYLEIRQQLGYLCSDYDDFAKRTGAKNFWYIGKAHDLDLLMSESGAVYAHVDDYLYYVAETGEQALEVLLAQQALRAIPE